MINKIGIIGGSYSGSTLLGAMLGSHSEIFYPGELYYHFACKPLKSGNCKKCSYLNQKCPLADDPKFSAIKPDRYMHDNLLAYSNKKVIVDGSKRPIWFHRFARDEKNWLIIHLIKSPQAFVASSISRGLAERKTVDEAIRIWIRDLILSNQLMEKYSNCYALPYEHFVQHPKAVVNFILRQCKLAPEFGLDKYWNFDLHFLGGNRSITSNFDNCKDIIPDDEPENKKMYKNKHRNIFLDEKWKSVLTKEQTEYITKKTEQASKLLNPNKIISV